MTISVEDSGTNSSLRNWRYRFQVASFLILIVGAMIAGFVLWARTPLGPLMPQVYTALQSDDVVTILHDDWLSFFPTSSPPRAGIIIYPEQRVPAEAYAPLAHHLSSQAYLVVIIDSLLRLPVLNIEAASAVIENFSAIEDWFIIGHGAGGRYTSTYAVAHPEQVDGLVLLGNIIVDDSFTDASLSTLVVYGSEDENNRRLVTEKLPPSTRIISIEGGTHAQFAYYIVDQPVSITHEQQTEETVQAIVELLQQSGH